MQDQPISGSPTPKRVRVEGVPNLYRRIRDGAYEVGYTGTDGRWHIVTLRGAENLTQAKRVMREILGKRDVSQDVAPNRMTFGEAAAEYFEMCAASLRCACLRCGARGLRPAASPIHSRPLSSWTIKSTIMLAGSILQHAVVHGYRADNPIQRLSKSERPKAKNATEARVVTAEFEARKGNDVASRLGQAFASVL
jgi:hypothetical protein